jgi:hypothetical protein
MKTVFAKSLTLLAGVVLVVPFVAVALLVGAQAAAGSGGADQRLVLAALALGGAFFGRVRGLKGQAAGRQGHTPRAPHAARHATTTLP